MLFRSRPSACWPPAAGTQQRPSVPEQSETSLHASEGTVWGFSVGRWPGPWRKKGNSAALCPCSCLDPCPGPQSAGSGRCHLSPQEGPGLEGCPVPSGDTGPRGQRSHLKYGPWKPRGARSVGYAADFRDVKREKQIKCLFHDLYIKMFKW